MSETKTTSKKKNSRIVSFFSGVKTEFKKIIWPDRDTLLKQLLTVLVIGFIMGGIITVIDFGFQNLIDFLMELSIG